MCTHQRLIYPPHSKRPLYVKCGKCPSCLQEKASFRVSRIHNTERPGYIVLMVTLTYSQRCAPYVDRSEAYDFVNGNQSQLNVYRDCTVRKVRKPSDYNDYTQVYKFNYTRKILETIDFIEDDYDVNLVSTKDLKHEHGKIGVCYYKDFQQFVARLRLNLKRHYDFQDLFFIYNCSEYGIKSQRPHFHLLVFIPQSAEKIFRAAIIESWPFSNLARFPRAIEKSFRSASYVASYVNKPSHFPNFFKRYFKEKHSYSKGFGVFNKNFDLSKILEKVERGFIKYTIMQNKHGIPTLLDVPIPSYVINRYFPKFKGYSVNPPCTLLQNMCRIARGDWSEFSQTLMSHYAFGKLAYHIDGEVYLTADELKKIRVRLLNAFERFKSCAPDGYSLLLEDYLRLHIKVWNCFNSSVLRLHMQNPNIPWYEKYDNLDFAIKKHLPLNGKFGFDSLREYQQIKETDPNKFQSVVYRTAVFTSSFNDNIKHRSVSNEIYTLSADSEL